MIPPTSIDGTDITGATIDGTDVQEITVDGDVVFTSTVELNGLLIDDFADGKLTNRDDFATTALSPSSLEPATSNTKTTGRPEYTNIQDSSVDSSTDELLQPKSSPSYVVAPLPSFSGTHEISIEGTGEGVNYVGLGVGNSIASSVGFPQNGYVFQKNATGGFAAIRRVTNGTATNLDDNQQSDNLPLVATFDDSGNFTLETGGGTLSASDTTHNFDHISIGMNGNPNLDSVRYSSIVVD